MHSRPYAPWTLPPPRRTGCWSAPPDQESVSLDIVLACTAHISLVRLSGLSPGTAASLRLAQDPLGEVWRDLEPVGGEEGSFACQEGSEVGRLLRVTLSGKGVSLGKVVVYGNRIAHRAPVAGGGGGGVEVQAKQTLEGVLQARGALGAGVQAVRPSWSNVHAVNTSRPPPSPPAAASDDRGGVSCACP